MARSDDPLRGEGVLERLLRQRIRLPVERGMMNLTIEEAALRQARALALKGNLKALTHLYELFDGLQVDLALNAPPTEQPSGILIVPSGAPTCFVDWNSLMTEAEDFSKRQAKRRRRRR